MTDIFEIAQALRVIMEVPHEYLEGISQYHQQVPVDIP
jgi:hypothetical protein